MITKDLAVPHAVDAVTHCYHFRLFACFERCKLATYITQDSQFSINREWKAEIWEMVDRSWLSKVNAIIEKSLPSPKSLDRLMAVVNFYFRALGGYLEFRRVGMGGEQYSSLPDGITEAGAEEVIETERRLTRDPGYRQFWFCDAEESVETETSDPFRAVASEWSKRSAFWAIKMSSDSHTGEQAESLPEAGTTIELNRSIESFGGFIEPGPIQVSSEYSNAYGANLVNLARGGRVLICGVKWPL